MASTSPPAPAQLGESLPGAAHEACVYLDYNATTPIYPQVAAAMAPFLFEHFGNPSCDHAFSRPCKSAVAEARGHVAALLNCDADEI
jgi:cysteine desulfurase